MTLMANRTEGSEYVTVRSTYGPITSEVTEHVSHVRNFWSELGRLIKEEKSDEKRAKAMFEAYCVATNGFNVRGEEIPAWENLGDSVQAAWIEAAKVQ